jgi:uncharacterized RmlC-like cupin family protein
MTPLVIALHYVLAGTPTPDVAPVVQNADFRVTKVQEAPGATSEAKERTQGTLLVFLTKGSTRITDSHGKSVTLKHQPSDSFWRPAGVTETVQNLSKEPSVFFEVEVKTRPDAKPLMAFPALDPVKIDPKHYKKLLENAQVRVVRALVPVGGKIPMHQHDTTRVNIFVTKHVVRVTDPAGVSKEGNEPPGTMKIGGPCKHSELNLSDETTDTVIIDAKLLP